MSRFRWPKSSCARSAWGGQERALRTEIGLCSSSRRRRFGRWPQPDHFFGGSGPVPDVHTVVSGKIPRWYRHADLCCSHSPRICNRGGERHGGSSRRRALRDQHRSLAGARRHADQPSLLGRRTSWRRRSAILGPWARPQFPVDAHARLGAHGWRTPRLPPSDDTRARNRAHTRASCGNPVSLPAVAFGFQVGGHVEAGGLFRPATAGDKTDPYAIGGISAGFNIHTSRNTRCRSSARSGRAPDSTPAMTGCSVCSKPASESHSSFSRRWPSRIPCSGSNRASKIRLAIALWLKQSLNDRG